MIANAGNVFGTFEPLALSLKVIGFLPIFWHGSCTTRQRVLNVIVLVWNIMLSLAFAYCVQSSFILQDSSKREFVVLVSSNWVLLVVCYGTPLVLIVAGFVLADRLHQIMLLIYQCDLKVTVTFVLFHKLKLTFESISAHQTAPQ